MMPEAGMEAEAANNGGGAHETASAARPAAPRPYNGYRKKSGPDRPSIGMPLCCAAGVFAQAKRAATLSR